MPKQTWRGGNMLYPLPVVMVSCANATGESDIITVAWTGTVCTNPPMLYVSVRPERNSYHIIRESGEFVVNLVGRRLARACDWCGVRSGRDHDKWEACRLTKARVDALELAPAIAEAPVSLACRVTQVLELGSHHMFLAEVAAVEVDEALLDESGKLDLGRAGLIAYSHGEYRDLGRCLGTFGYSVRKGSTGGKATDAQREATRGSGPERRRPTGGKIPSGKSERQRPAGGKVPSGKPGQQRPSSGKPNAPHAKHGKRPGTPRRGNGSGHRA